MYLISFVSLSVILKHQPIVVTFLTLCLLVLISAVVHAQISIPDDAPQPLSPAESAAAVSLPHGFSLNILAAEPLIRNPSGVCWDQQGRLFVCELHGYNMEGQYDIEELNKTGKLDREVRRISAPEEAIKKAEQDQTGSVKRLIDADGDGVMDKADVWADDLPACFGLVPARDGVIVVCAPEIVFLADRDNDGFAEVRETLFAGFRTGVLERRMSAPQWGVDNWIYVAAGGGTITGPALKSPIEMPHNDFRFKPDGSAIEPLHSGTGTFGFTFSTSDDRYVISTSTPAIYVAPLPWRYLSRNPHVGFSRMTVDVGPGQQTYPTSNPHPWRSRRASDPAFEELYRTRYGATESAPNGYFTSACSPLAYQDTALPLTGQLLACEPAQNMIHRSIITRDGLIPKLKRPEGEQRSEFLASSDVWFHPIAMSHAPDGAVVISDFYREIIEDYSAIPRYLQQQYQLKHGEQHGRLWRLVHRDMPRAESADISRLDSAELVGQLASPRHWRRQTAQRLLVERDAQESVADLRSLVTSNENPAVVIAALHTLDALGKLSEPELKLALRHVDPAVIVQALRLADQQFEKHPSLLDQALTFVNHKDDRVLLQLALSLGETPDSRAGQSLAMLAFQSIDIPWMDDAILSSLYHRPADVMQSLFLQTSTDSPSPALAKFLSRLCKMIAGSPDNSSLSRTLMTILQHGGSTEQQHACLDGLKQGFEDRRKVELSDRAEAALRSATERDHQPLADAARFLLVAMKLETPSERSDRLQATSVRIADVQLPVDHRIDAVNELAKEQDEVSTNFLLASIHPSTPAIRMAILEAVFARKTNRSLILAAIESGQLPVSILTAVQRELFLQDPDDAVRTRAATLFANRGKLDRVKTGTFLEALAADRDLVNGETVFKKLCSNCHQVRGIGFDVGPDLVSEFGRSEQTFVQDILAPNATISPGYTTYILQTVDGRVVAGLMSAESPTSVTLRQEQGKEQTILRRDIEAIRASEASLMPEDLAKTVTPKDVADVIAWLRSSGPQPSR